MVESLRRHQLRYMSEQPSRLERINHWIRVFMAIVIPAVFIIGMIAYYFKYRG
ncbi:MAG: hypothetical protein AB1515_07465 [Nitrospirota bacterium]